VLPGQRLLTWQVPGLARRIQAGQLVHLLAPRPSGSLLPALPAAGYDRVSGTVALLANERSPGAELLRLRDGDQVRLDGPIGRGFRVDARSRHLLLVCDGSGIARVRALLDEAISGGRQVTLLLGVGSAAEVLPSWLLPDEAEYGVATADGSLGHRGDVTDLVLHYEAWADQCFAAGAWSMLERLAVLARGRDARLGVARLGRRPGRRGTVETARRASWLQVALPHEASCALGVCLGCVVDGTDGPMRVCREGPAFSAGELAWESSR
jgi:dihydroorotate dehydrogenase electron transfer subunit